MLEDLEAKASRDRRYYSFNHKLCNLLFYGGMAVLAAVAADVAHTHFTGSTILSQWMGIGSPRHEYFLDAMAGGIALFSAYNGKKTRDYLKNEESQKNVRNNF